MRRNSIKLASSERAWHDGCCMCVLAVVMIGRGNSSPTEPSHDVVFAHWCVAKGGRRSRDSVGQGRRVRKALVSSPCVSIIAQVQVHSRCIFVRARFAFPPSSHKRCRFPRPWQLLGVPPPFFFLLPSALWPNKLILRLMTQRNAGDGSGPGGGGRLGIPAISSGIMQRAEAATGVSWFICG
ncbi:hypothetical protein B0T25DRAFT_286684 [Lasiosphaeria hispida]|uniref:Uncharacterized protein n=1 Tax=Lasiosphaeria hispida TaxID=260671 RepID=A0AAJ0HBV5_9PEZI|nr:hypothetical protein B0T25DRAFT_286684 [Lasiosphaeria hispida]